MSVDIDIEIPAKFEPLFQPARYKAAWGGRGSAKSHSFASALVLLGATQQLKIMCCREYQSSIKDSVKFLVDAKIQKYHLSHLYKSTRTEIINRETGTQFIFGGLAREPEKIKSTEGIDICWVEEAQTTSQTSWDYLVPTVRNPGSEIWVSYNPKYEAAPIYQRFNVNPRPNDIIINVNYDDNPFFPDVLREEMEYDKEHDYEKFLHIWRGQLLQNSEAKVFNGKWRLDERIEPGPKDVLRYGADFGFSVDPATLIRLWVDEEKREIYIDYEFYKVKVEIEDLPKHYETVPGSKKWKITADSSRPETISHLKRKGYRIEGAKKGKDSVEEGIEFLKSYTIVVHPRCVHTIDELGLYSYKVDRITGDVLPILEDKNNHIIDAMRYALEQLVFRRAKRINIG